VAKYLVTGAAGFIGRSIAAALLRRGESVRGIDSFITGKRSNLAGLEEMEFVEGDLTNPADCARACAGVEVVFHEAALASVPRSVADPASTNQHCVTATLNLLVAARDAGVRRVVYAGSSSAYGDTPTLPKKETMLPKPISPYAVAKLAGEQYMQAFTRVYGLETVTLRYFNVFGPRQDPQSQYAAAVPIFIDRAVKHEPITIHGDGEQTRDFIYVKDIVAANVFFATESPATGVFNVAYGQHITINNLARTICRLTGSHSEIRHAAERSGDVKHSLAAIGKLREAGFKPTSNFGDGLKTTVEFFAQKQHSSL